MSVLKTIIQLRRDTEANWLISKHVIPAAGEPCLTLDGAHAGMVKYGDGVTTWENLPYSGAIGDDKTIEVVDGVVRIKGSDAASAGQTFRISTDGTGIEWYTPADAGSVETVKQEVKAVEESVKSVTEEVTSLKSVVDTKANAGDVYTKDEVKTLVSTAFDYKGTVATRADLDLIEAPESGDVYQVGDGDGFYVFDGDSWEDFGMPIDLSGYVTKEMFEPVQEAISELPSVYMTKTEGKQFAKVEYEIFDKMANTIVDYRDKEIRVLFPADTDWELRPSGENSQPDMYYMGFKAYAPENAVSFKEDLAEVISDQTMYQFEDNDFAGIDEIGRKYSVVWLPVAKYDSVADSWLYYGSMSSSSKCIGWYYNVEWYDADGIKIDADLIRINLTNEACHLAESNVNVDTLVQSDGSVLILDGGDSNF